MKYCRFCGGEMEDDNQFCPSCGKSVETNFDQLNKVQEKPESSGLGIASIVFGALGGFLGLIFGIIGLSSYKDPKNRRNCKIGIGLFIGWIILYIIINFLPLE